MKRIYLSLIFATAILTGCKNENTTAEERVEEDVIQEENEFAEEEQEAQTIVVELEPRSGSDVSGTVTFTEENGEVVMQARIVGLEEGRHALHLHENADCSAADATSAGGHWNPTFEDHGEWGDPEGFHRGDVGNFDVNAEGVGIVNFSTDLWCIGCEDEKENILNKAVIVHEGVDDYESQPSGAAGSRLACAGIIER